MKPGLTLLQHLRAAGEYLPAVCGGRGKCGKCGVKILADIPEPTPADREFFPEEALAEGYRLACMTEMTDGMSFQLERGKTERDDFQIQTAYEEIEPLPPSSRRYAASAAPVYGIAIDIGTTTIAFELLNLKTGLHMATHALVNSQRAFGADVVTRIEYAARGKQEELRAYVLNDIQRGVDEIINASGIDPARLAETAVTGNTTMLHILRGMDCAPLGQYPFTPVSVEMARVEYADIFLPSQIPCPVTVLPGASAFVGADIMAGILFCGGLKSERPSLLIDLGTNGEMALFSKHGVTVTSTAAGPAFEAGNISHGAASIPGAISNVTYNNKKAIFEYETIAFKPPIGICGSGVIALAAQLIKHGLADETGLLDDEFFEEGIPVAGGIVFTQKDMREIQLAKSAVRSGIEVLLNNTGAKYIDIDRVYLAGGFGQKIDLDSAEILGIFPKGLRPKITAIGNSALGGCARVLLEEGAENDIKAIAAAAKEINLSADKLFNDLFMQHMMFGD